MEMLGLESALKSLPAILEIKEVAAFLNVSESTVYRLANDGKIKAFRAAGESLNIVESDLEAFCKKNETL